MTDTRVRWHFHASCPPDWPTHIERCGAGFFHSPAGLAATGVRGDPFFGELTEGDEIVGIAAGLLRRCRVPPRPNHAHLPAPPALLIGSDVSVASVMKGLLEGARGAGWTDLTVDSLEAAGIVSAGDGGLALPSRAEYDIPLQGAPEELEGRLARQHRRRLSEGAEWTLRTLSGPDARQLLVEVTGMARDRAATRRGVTYSEVVLPPLEAFREDPAWGMTTYAAMHGDTPLSAALIGWAGKRAYYVSGGSTPDGYARNASVWLHFQIARAFQCAGFTHYSLGGAPASAVDSADPSHGLHRFKTGFGAEVRACAGARWVFGTEHEKGHRFTRWLRDHLVGSKEIA